jgi:hypothetical protein
MQIIGNTILITGAVLVSGVDLRRLFTPREIKSLLRGDAKGCSTKQ